jgi:hypothetical protein
MLEPPRQLHVAFRACLHQAGHGSAGPHVRGAYGISANPATDNAAGLARLNRISGMHAAESRAVNSPAHVLARVMPEDERQCHAGAARPPGDEGARRIAGQSAADAAGSLPGAGTAPDWIWPPLNCAGARAGRSELPGSNDSPGSVVNRVMRVISCRKGEQSDAGPLGAHATAAHVRSRSVRGGRLLATRDATRPRGSRRPGRQYFPGASASSGRR